MAIRFRCSCGQAMKAGDEMAGKKAKCPTCKKVVSVPGASTDGSTVAVPVGVAAAAAKQAKERDEYEELGLEAPRVGAREGDEVPRLREDGLGGARICVTCGYDLATGQAHAAAGRKKVVVEEEDDSNSGYERGPWFSVLGIEFTTLKLVLVGVLFAGILGFFFGVMLPAKYARAEFETVTQGLQGPLLTEINKQVDEHSTPNTNVNRILFHEPMYLLSVPEVLTFEAFITGDDITTATFDVIRGSYDRKSGELKLNMPNKNDSGATGRVDVVAAVTPAQVAAAGGPGKAAIPVRPKNPPERTKQPEEREGAKFWEVGAPDYTFAVRIEPWPVKAGMLCKVIATASMDDYERTFSGRVWYRVVKDDDSFADWIPFKQTREAKDEAEAMFEFETLFASGKWFIQFKVARVADFINENHVELTDWWIDFPPAEEPK